MNKIITDQDFIKIDFSSQSFQKGVYEHCRFINCGFNQTDLSGCLFTDCEFIDCDMSMVNLNQTGL